MKYILYTCLLLSTAVYGQEVQYSYPNMNVVVDTIKCKAMKPYLSAGASVSGRTLSYAIEEGFYNHDWWVGVTEELDRDAFGHLTQVYIGPKLYKTIADINDNSQLFIYAAIKDNVKYHDLILEPGLAYCFLSGAKWALQVSLSSPIYEGQQIGNPTNLQMGLCVNYWVK